jgi:hypothetical protein
VRAFATTLALCALAASAQRAAGLPEESDVFVTASAVALRDGASLASKVVARLEPGVHGTLIERRAGFLRVRVATDAGQEGWLSRDLAAVFPAGPQGSADLAAAGRFLAADPARRGLALALLARGAVRLSEAGMPDAATEICLGETAEARGEPGAAEAFERARSLLERPAGAERRSPLLSRADAGLLRARFPKTGTGLAALLRESEAWLELVEAAGDGEVTALAADRAGAAALELGRLLLAAGRLEELGGLARRLDESVSRMLPDGRGDAAPRLAGRAALLRSMRGSGGPAFPQEVSYGLGPRPMAFRIQGDLGQLELVVSPAAGGPARRLAQPVLPVPGSLRVSSDGRCAAWLEVSAPSTIAPFVACRDGAPVADALHLAGGRPLRDRKRRHTVTALLGFSGDGSKLGLAVAAWDDQPPERSRLTVLQASSAEVLLDAASTPAGLALYRSAMR